MKFRLVCLSALLPLAACGSHGVSGDAVRGYLMGQGMQDPIVRWTVGNLAIDDRACGSGVLYAFAAKNASGLACASDDKVWIIAKSDKALNNAV